MSNIYLRRFIAILRIKLAEEKTNERTRMELQKIFYKSDNPHLLNSKSLFNIYNKDLDAIYLSISLRHKVSKIILCSPL